MEAVPLPPIDLEGGLTGLPESGDPQIPQNAVPDPEPLEIVPPPERPRRAPVRRRKTDPMAGFSGR